MEYIVETNNLVKKYNNFIALNGLNIHVKKGSIYGLIGKNGSGKTTFIRMVCGIQHPTSGTYSLYGISNKNSEIIEARKRVGAIIESPAIYYDMTAEENLKQQYKIIGLPSYKSLKSILKIVNLDKTEGKIAKNFSLGMKQRLGIAIALVGNPDLIILDEPINGLDPEGIIEIRELILRLNKEKGITFIISSHYLDELSKIATCYGFMDKGKIIKEIDSLELKKNSKKIIKIKVNNVVECVKLFEEKKIPYEVIRNDEIDIYEDLNISALAIALAKRNCVIKEYKVKEESLESYYINLVGGEANV